MFKNGEGSTVPSTRMIFIRPALSMTKSRSSPGPALVIPTGLSRLVAKMLKLRVKSFDAALISVVFDLEDVHTSVMLSKNSNNNTIDIDWFADIRIAILEETDFMRS
jgi:hypothetical protein